MLEENYYLANFRSLIEFVGKTYSGLLTEQERAWYSEISGASEDVQRLYARLSNRRVNVFRVNKLKYPEITNITDAVSKLEACHLADTDVPGELPELLGAFTKPELIKRLKLSDQRLLSRADLEDYIAENCSQSELDTLQQSEKWVRLTGLDTFAVFKLCFFGNSYQDMSEFVLRDLGIFNYEQYTIDETTKVFQSREQLDAHIQYFNCAATLEETDQSDAQNLLQLDAALPSNKTHDAHLTRRVDRFRNVIARQLERLDRPDEALALYCQSEKPPSRERQVRLLMKLERSAEAKQLCDDILEKPFADEETQFVETITPKLYKQLDLRPPRKATFRPATTKLTLQNGDARVERVARDFYAQFGDCFYAENTLVNGVLGLFIWDIIFTPINGAFFNPFQSAPADFYQVEFVESREEELTERFKELSQPLRFSARVLENYENKKGLMNPLVRWQHLSEELLSLALIRIPAKHWRAMFDRILSDMCNNTSGLPDLILFPKDGNYEMLEIKGPGDALQKNQKRWMAYFSEHRIPYRVVYIRWAK